MQRKIMFVCHGNICRSPMAEFIFKDIIAEKGIADRFFVCSSATSDEEIWGNRGNPIDIRAKETLLAHDIFVGEKYAVQLKKSDYGEYELFVVMDSKNLANAKRIFGGDPENKIKKLLDYTDFGGDVKDPWYSGNFEEAYRDIYLGCKAMLESIE